MTPRLAASGLARGAGCGVSGTGVDAGGEVAEHERMRALREIKNQIMGNQTKKFLYLRLGTVPTVVAALAEPGASLAAARVGSYACGVDDSKQAILAADTVGAPHPTPRTLRGDVLSAEENATTVLFVVAAVDMFSPPAHTRTIDVEIYQALTMGDGHCTTSTMPARHHH